MAHWLARTQLQAGPELLTAAQEAAVAVAGAAAAQQQQQVAAQQQTQVVAAVERGRQAAVAVPAPQAALAL